MLRHFKKILSINHYNKNELNGILKQISEYKNEEYVAIYNPFTTGVMNSTKQLFKNTASISELLNSKEIDIIAESIVSNNISQVIFSPIVYGWKELIENIKEKNDKIKIKFFWHGSHSLFVNRDESYFLYNILELHDRGLVCSIAFAKDSMAEFYKQKGYNSYFVKNNITNINQVQIKKLEMYKKYDIQKDKSMVNFGLYAAGDRWEKNIYNQLSAISMVKNSIVDLVPVNKTSENFCNMINLKLKKYNGYLTHDKLLCKMAVNDINMAVTFTECAPMTPLESMEVGTICLTGNNHHYFKGTELEKYLIVNSEDDIDEIYQKIDLALKNKEKILKLYKLWKKEYNEDSIKSVQKFLTS